MAKITLPDGNQIEIADGESVLNIAEKIGPKLAKAALAGRIDGKLVDLSTPVSQDCSIELITSRGDCALEIIRHSCAHIMAKAICRIWPKAQLVYGPTVQDGFYYDIDLDDPIRPDDFKKIEQEMEKIVKADEPFTRIEQNREQAIKRVAGNKYKIDNIERADGDVISFYRLGEDFEDLCRGPHIPSASKAGAFKVMSVAGAYWHGNADEKMLQRVYGTAWLNKNDLKDYLYRLEEAKKRDHRIIGKQLDLFSFSEMGPGFPFMHPNGMVIWNGILEFVRGLLAKYDYKESKTPIILNEQLWHRSGHWDNYKENMYFTDIDETPYAIKPMNCPGGCLLYKTGQHSYRDLPLRVAEFGLVHRHEASGVMHGLFRVRQFTQDDAHIYCLPEQIESEIIGTIDMIFETYKAFGFEEIAVELSTKPEKHIGSDEIWEVATEALKGALEHKSIDYEINEGDGAFYGPKIDFHIKDCLGRSWQLGTIQLDFSMPQRFELTYTDKDNTEKTPVMIHRAVLGSLERFMGILIEHYAGGFPAWLAPEQVKILTISEKTNDYAQQVYQQLKQAGIRCTLDLSGEKIGAKIAKAHAMKPPFMLVIGSQEAEQNAVNIRIRGLKQTKTLPLDVFFEKIKEMICSKSETLEL